MKAGWNDPKWKELEKKTETARRIFGAERVRAAEMMDDCVQYPIDEIVKLAKWSLRLENETDAEVLREETEKFRAFRESIQKKSDAPEPIQLWPGQNPPVMTDYTDNRDYRYNHNPDWKPRMYFIPAEGTEKPAGAVIFCAGGDHGEANVHEAYQDALDFAGKGYQCFILLNRTNHNPWNEKEAGADAARAVRYVRAHAGEYGIGERNIAFAGFSNGGLTGEALIEYYSGKQKVADYFPDYVPDALDDIDATPDAFLCIYGPRFAGSSFDWDGVVYPPVFFAVGRKDGAMDNLNAVWPDLMQHHVPVEVHTFAGTPHGQAGAKIFHDGVVEYPNFELWQELADYFLQDVFHNH